MAERHHPRPLRYAEPKAERYHPSYSCQVGEKCEAEHSTLGYLSPVERDIFNNATYRCGKTSYH